MTDNERHIEMLKKRAYAIWEAEGRPAGRDSDHWDQAVAEFGSEPAAAAEQQVAAPPAKKAPAAKRSKAASSK